MNRKNQYQILIILHNLMNHNVREKQKQDGVWGGENIVVITNYHTKVSKNLIPEKKWVLSTNIYLLRNHLL